MLTKLDVSASLDIEKFSTTLAGKSITVMFAGSTRVSVVACPIELKAVKVNLI